MELKTHRVKVTYDCSWEEMNVLASRAAKFRKGYPLFGSLQFMNQLEKQIDQYWWNDRILAGLPGSTAIIAEELTTVDVDSKCLALKVEALYLDEPSKSVEADVVFFPWSTLEEMYLKNPKQFEFRVRYIHLYGPYGIEKFQLTAIDVNHINPSDEEKGESDDAE